MSDNSLEKDYYKIVLLVVGMAVPVTVAAVIYLWASSSGTRLIWETLPATFLPGINRPIFTVIVTTLGGLLVGLTLRYLGGQHEGKSLQQELVEDGAVNYRGLLGLIVAAVIGLSFGASLGPEAPLAHLGGGIGTWVSERLKLAKNKMRIVSLSGISAAFGALIGTPVGSAFMSIEFTGMLGFPLYLYLVAAIAAGLVGHLVFSATTGISMIGVLHFETLGGMRPVYLLYAVLLGAFGLVLAAIFKIIHSTTRQLVDRLPENPLLKPVVGGLGFGLVGAFLPLTLFSGEHELVEVIESGAQLGVAMLLLIAIAKLFTLSLCMTTGFPGGFIFPLLFSAGALGVVTNLLVPAIPVSVAVVCLMAGMGGAVMRMPISVILLVGVLSQSDLVPVIIVATLTAFLLVQIIPSGDARQAYSENEAKARAAA